MNPKTKVLVVDDHPLVREWLANLINEDTEFEVCGQAGSSAMALGLLPQLQPQVMVVDISLEGSSGIELIKDAHALQPELGMVVLSMHDELLYAERALRAGALGYVMKREATEKVLAALRAVAQGQLFVSSAVNPQLTSKHAPGAGTPVSDLAGLSDRELEVFELLGSGLSTRQVSTRLNVGFKTVHAYCARIREKMNLASLNELVFHAIRWREQQTNPAGAVTKETGV